MPRAAQEIDTRNLEVSHESGCTASPVDFASVSQCLPDPYGLSALLRDLREEHPADPELDALLDTLDEAVPADEPVTVRGRPLDWLDAGPDEEPAPAAANDNQAPASVAKNPKKRSARPRRSFAADRRKLNILNGFVSDARTMKTAPAGAPLVADPLPAPTPSPTNTNTPSKSTKKRRAADENDTRRAPAWARTTEIAKAHAVARTVSVTGAGVAWTLNLGGKVAQAANDNAKGLKERLHDRLVKALKASPLGAREFMFVPERTKGGRWHLHGIADVADDERDAFATVLRQVGGAWDSAHHAERQVDVRPAWCPDGWVRYMLKAAAATRRLLGCKSVLSATRECQRRAKDLWETARRQSALT